MVTVGVGLGGGNAVVQQRPRHLPALRGPSLCEVRSRRGRELRTTSVPSSGFDAGDWHDDLGTRWHQNREVHRAILFRSHQLFAIDDEDWAIATVQHLDLRHAAGFAGFRDAQAFGAQRLTIRAVAAGTLGMEQHFAFFGGPVTAPGYDYHSLWSVAGASVRAEWRTPVPFSPFSLGRFGRVPSRGAIAPFANVVYLSISSNCVELVSGSLLPDGVGDRPRADGCLSRVNAAYPSVGIGYLTPFDLIRFDVARGLRDGRWMFYVDVSREFWRIL